MATIFYSMAGEGRGHAIRVRTIVEQLRREHQLQLFAPGVAYDFLAAAYAGTEVKVTKIPGLLFHYTRQQLDYLRTGWEGLKYLYRLPRLVRRMRQLLELHEVDLVISDFEPALARAARKTGVPLISLDHQHFLTVSDLSSLPAWLRVEAEVSSWIVNAYYHGQCETIVSSFYFPPLKPRYEGRVQQIGVLLRQEVLEAVPESGEHLLVYLRRFATLECLAALNSCGREVRVYGLGARPDEGHLRFFPIDEAGFLEDLRTCHAVVTNAGNQLVGEALALHKPILGIPEQRNFEQFINAHYLRESGGGDWCRMEEFSAARLQQFLDDCPRFRSASRHQRLCGNSTALRIIRQHLPAPRIPVLQQPFLHSIYS